MTRAPASAPVQPEGDSCQTYGVDLQKVRTLKPRVERARGLSLLFKALADDTRVQIAYGLSQAELCVCEVAELVGTSVATASHHLRLLRNMGLVRYRREGKMIYYSLDDHHVLQLIQASMEHLEEGPRR